MAHRGTDNAYGDLAERRAKMDAKYDLAVEAGVREWIKARTGTTLGADFQAELKNGVVLCELINALAPNSVKRINKSDMSFKQMENIGNFIGACSEYGMKPEDNFQTVDLYEATNMGQVLLALQNLKTISERKAKGETFAAVKPKESVLLATKVSSEPTPKPAAANPNSLYYDKSGKDVVSASAQPTASGRAGENTYGDLAERRARMEAKYDKTLEVGVKAWIEERSGEKIGDDFQAGLKNGQILCKLANAIKPGSIKTVNTQSMAFKQMENINNFLAFAASLGLPETDKFQTVDLYEGTNMTVVLSSLNSFQRIVQSKKL